MADEQEKKEAGHRFRLPKLFTQGAEAAAEAALDDVVPRQAQNAPSKPALPKPTEPAHTESKFGTSVLFKGTAKKADANGSPDSLTNAEVVAQLAAMSDVLGNLSDQISHVNERETSLERVFDALHSELADYKNDFLYEHLKPVVRPLLFLFDSIEQFDGEIAMAEATMTQASSGELLSPPVVRENVSFFRDQLIEALRVCEVTIMDVPQGAFNAKFHKAVDVMPVPSEDDNTIVRVVRSGWFLNGQLLRPAEVVVGKFRG